MKFKCRLLSISDILLFRDLNPIESFPDFVRILTLSNVYLHTDILAESLYIIDKRDWFNIQSSKMLQALKSEKSKNLIFNKNVSDFK